MLYKYLQSLISLNCLLYLYVHANSLSAVESHQKVTMTGMTMNTSTAIRAVLVMKSVEFLLLVASGTRIRYVESGRCRYIYIFVVGHLTPSVNSH